jgi:hypothetical protein
VAKEMVSAEIQQTRGFMMDEIKESWSHEVYIEFNSLDCSDKSEENG